MSGTRMASMAAVEFARIEGVEESAVIDLCRAGKIPGAKPPTDLTLHWTIPVVQLPRTRSLLRGEPFCQKCGGVGRIVDELDAGTIPCPRCSRTEAKAR